MLRTIKQNIYKIVGLFSIHDSEFPIPDLKWLKRGKEGTPPGCAWQLESRRIYYYIIGTEFIEEETPEIVKTVYEADLKTPWQPRHVIRTQKTVTVNLPDNEESGKEVKNVK